jgi:hypothetical protein
MKKVARQPKCRCQSTKITATSSTQFRTIRGKRRAVADAVCGSCGNTWWSINPAIIAMARAQDKARKQ